MDGLVVPIWFQVAQLALVVSIGLIVLWLQRRYPTRHELTEAMAVLRTERRAEVREIESMVRDCVARELGGMRAEIHDIAANQARVEGSQAAEIEHIKKALGGMHAEFIRTRDDIQLIISALRGGPPGGHA